jgi:hypothetical protein
VPCPNSSGRQRNHRHTLVRWPCRRDTSAQWSQLSRLLKVASRGIRDASGAHRPRS